MFKLLCLLAAGMFLTLLIGGRDAGQQRFGLAGHYAPPARVEVARAAEAPAAATVAPIPAAAVVLANLPVEPAAPAVPALPTFALAPAQPSAPAETPAPVEPAVAAPEPLPLRWVAANAVNVRGGPSTADAIIGRLVRNEAVAVVSDAGDGWLLVRLEGDGVEGYVASRFLTDRAP